MIADCRQRIPLVLACAAGLISISGVTAGAEPVAAAAFQCRHGDLLRRVEVSTGDAVQDGACEVRYWRDASSPPEGQVLWQADQDPDYCRARARELLARLEKGGWACAPSDAPEEAEPLPTAAGAGALESPAVAAPPAAPARQAAGTEEPTPVAARPPAVAAGTHPAGPTAAAAQTSAPAEDSPSGSAQAQRSMPPEHRPPPAVDEQAAAAEAEAHLAGPSDEPSALADAPSSTLAARSPEASADGFDRALLDRVVGQTLRSVEEMYGGEFRAEEAAFGDLDGDGRNDAAVLITYEDEHEDYVQYLVAYLFDDGTFKSTATKNVGGRFLDALRADVREISDRAILVELTALNARDVCCETRTVAFILKDGQLIEVEDRADASKS